MPKQYTIEDHHAHVEAREAEEKAAREKAAENLEKYAARSGWIKATGSDKGFHDAWPEIRDEGRRRRAEEELASREAQAREAHKHVSKL